jgi:hypothetical protein
MPHRRLAKNPIVFSDGQPRSQKSGIPHAGRPDVNRATRRSDYPNQVNNVLGFPFMFRGALDVPRAQDHEEMKIAAASARAELAREQVTDNVHPGLPPMQELVRTDYLIPKPFEPARAIAGRAAVAGSGEGQRLARQPSSTSTRTASGPREPPDRARAGDPPPAHATRAIARSFPAHRRSIPTGPQTERSSRAAQILVDEGSASPCSSVRSGGS